MLPSEVILVIILSSAASLKRGDIVAITTVHKIRSKGGPFHQVVTPGPLGYIWAQEGGLRPHSGGGYAGRKGPSMVATQAWQIVATSEDRGRPYCQSRPTVQQDASRRGSWRAAMVTAADSCDRTMKTLVFWVCMHALAAAAPFIWHSI